LKKKISEKTAMVKPSGIRRLFDLSQGVKDVISLGIGEPDFDTPKHIVEAAKKALDEGYTHYTPNAGFLELREAIARKLWLENRIKVDPRSEIIVTVGGTGALFLSILSIIDPGDEVLIPDPGFLTYEPCVIFAGGRAVPVPVHEKDDFRMLPEEVKSRITSRTKCVVINSPQNPTGSVMLKKDLEAISEIAEKHDLFVISDEVYEKLTFDSAEHFSIASIPSMDERTITVNSFSKTYAMAGWRVGYATSKSAVIDEMVKLQQNIVANASSVAQMAALAALKGPQDCVKEMVDEYDRRRLLITRRLNEINGISCRAPRGAFYVFANITQLGKSSEEVAEFLLNEGKVVAVPGSAFGRHGEGYLRFCYATPMEKLEKALDRIEKAVGKIRE